MLTRRRVETQAEKLRRRIGRRQETLAERGPDGELVLRGVLRTIVETHLRIDERHLAACEAFLATGIVPNARTAGGLS